MKKIVTIISFLIIIIFTFSACSQSNGAEGKQDFKYFKIKHFFESEMARLEKKAVKVDKKVTLNKASENKTATTIDWEKELSLFANSDINKAAWSDQYQVDTIKELGKVIVEYKAKNENLKTQSIQLTYPNSTSAASPNKIAIVNQTHNAIYKHLERLTYETNKSYVIDTKQSVLGMQPDEMLIEGRFLK